mmetsp:Transcript_81159/g.175403  ORF Transcript_81159/g.175403 Transcript_81159/m.175403 type:complete len:104 (-) Transcript_81159:114-425(-)
MAEAAAAPSDFSEKTLKCKDCDCDWVFTVGEQEFYAGKGFENEPTRCKECRKKKKSERYRRNRAARKTGGAAATPGSNVCFAFQKGECTRGEECRFKHTLESA